MDEHFEDVDLFGDFDSDDESYGGLRVKFSVDENSEPDDDLEWGSRSTSWEVPSMYKMIWIDGDIDPQDVKYHRLMDLLLHDERRWGTIYLSREGRHSTPQFLSLLQATFSKTDHLHLSDCMTDDASYSCLNSGLLVTGGIRNVEIWTSVVRPILREQMSILSQGLSMTTTLETLSLPGDLTIPGVVEFLIAGLEANTSLKHLRSCWSSYPPGSLPLVLSALHSHPRLSRFMLRTDELRHSEVQQALRSLLSRDDCKIEDLDLMRGSTSERNGPIAPFNLGKFDNPNTPLKKLHLGRIGINDSALCAMLPSCKNLVELDLTDNKISDLGPLDVLLLEEPCFLEKLILEDNPISIDSARIFAHKLPNMKKLAHLSLRKSPFLEDGEFLEEFLSYANQNMSLERLRIFTRYDEVDALIPRLMYGPGLNRAGRKYLGHNPGSLPLELLPVVFVRAREILYYDPLRARFEEPTARLDGLDATFWLLRENGALLSHLL